MKHILVFSSLFPHSGEPTLGIFVENRLRELLKTQRLTATVIAPVPWFPFKSNIFGSYGRAAQATRVEKRGGVTIYHPRYLVIPKIGMALTPYFMYLSALRCIKKLLKQGIEFDLIDAHYLYPDGIAAASLSATLGKPFVMTARGSDVTEIGLMPGPRKRIKKALKSASHIITVSNNLRRDLIAMGGEEKKITTLRNGVDLERFYETGRNEMRTEWGTEWAKGPILLFAGWLIPRKRLDIVLEVTARVSALKTVIVGDGPLRALLEKQCNDLGITDRVRFVGQKTPAEMPTYFSAADLLLLPSDREGWANVLLEAMACGTPVVTRAIGGAPDLVTKTCAGRVVDSASPDALSSAVRDLLENRPSRADTRAFAEKFDWGTTSEGQNLIFDAAIKEYTKSSDI